MACSTPNLDEATLEAAFVEAYNRMLGNKEQYIARFEEMLPLLADTSKLERQLAEVQNKHSHLMNNLRLYYGRKHEADSRPGGIQPALF